MSVPKAPPPGTARTRKYKWSITANDHYLWQNSGGTTPLKVDFGGKPPPSAPKDLRKGVRRRSVQKVKLYCRKNCQTVCAEWEEPDGYEYEVIQEERTLELVVTKINIIYKSVLKMRWRIILQDGFHGVHAVPSSK